MMLPLLNAMLRLIIAFAALRPAFAAFDAI